MLESKTQSPDDRAREREGGWVAHIHSTCIIRPSALMRLCVYAGAMYMRCLLQYSTFEVAPPRAHIYTRHCTHIQTGRESCEAHTYTRIIHVFGARAHKFEINFALQRSFPLLNFNAVFVARADSIQPRHARTYMYSLKRVYLSGVRW